MSMDQNQLRAGVIECVAQSLAIGTDAINENSRIITDLGADSLDFMDIMFSLERKFDIKLQKEDFDLLARVEMKREEAIVDGNLVPLAKERLRKWLPGIPMEGELKPKDLGGYITIQTLMVIVQEFLSKKS